MIREKSSLHSIYCLPMGGRFGDASHQPRARREGRARVGCVVRAVRVTKLAMSLTVYCMATHFCWFPYAPKMSSNHMGNDTKKENTTLCRVQIFGLVDEQQENWCVPRVPTWYLVLEGSYINQPTTSTSTTKLLHYAHYYPCLEGLDGGVLGTEVGLSLGFRGVQLAGRRQLKKCTWLEELWATPTHMCSR